MLRLFKICCNAAGHSASFNCCTSQPRAIARKTLVEKEIKKRCIAHDPPMPYAACDAHVPCCHSRGEKEGAPDPRQKHHPHPRSVCPGFSMLLLRAKWQYFGGFWHKSRSPCHPPDPHPGPVSPPSKNTSSNPGFGDRTRRSSRCNLGQFVELQALDGGMPLGLATYFDVCCQTNRR